jgi:ubiquinone/menaquinone biosynthesis C-methylase UbiE
MEKKISLSLVQKKAVEQYEKSAKGDLKKYPSLELVRLEKLFLRPRKSGKLLEYAIGSGSNTIHLLESGYKVFGLDVAKGALKNVKKRLKNHQNLKKNIKLSLISLDARKIPYKNNFFTHAVAMSVLSLLGNEQRARLLLSELKRVIKPKGKLIVDINDHDSEFSKGNKKVGKNIFLAKPVDNYIQCFCLKNQNDFKKLIRDYFEIIDTGHSSHEVFGRRINEWIICAVKK